jgi:hypothetical protein
VGCVKSSYFAIHRDNKTEWAVSAIFERYAFKFHYGLWLTVAFCALMSGAMNAGYRDVAKRQAESAIMAQIPEDVYSGLPVELLTKIPVSK